MLRLLIAFATFLVLTGVVQAAPYRLRPGDRLEVTVWQEPKLNRVIVVAPDGRITFPLVGHLQAGGTTVEAVESALKARLAKQYTSDIDVSVAIAGVKEEPVAPMAPEEKLYPGFFVTGEVAKPGRYEFRRSVNILQAIALAGGLGPFAAEHRIKIRRKENGSETLYEFDYDAFTSGKDLTGNMVLRDGDVVIVPERGLFE